MKKFLSLILALTMVFTLAACGSKDNDSNTDGDAQIETPAETPDLQSFFDGYMDKVVEELGGEDNAPSMMAMEDDVLDAFYPGLSEIAVKQLVAEGAAISAVAFEFVLVEAENEADVAAIQTILQDRLTAQAEGGAWYPETVECWENGEVVTHGNVVALIVASDFQADAVESFNALFA